MSNTLLVNQLVQAAAQELQNETVARRQARNKRKAARRQAKAAGKPETCIPAGFNLTSQTPKLELARRTPPKKSEIKGYLAKGKEKVMKRAAKTEKQSVKRAVLKRTVRKAASGK